MSLSRSAIQSLYTNRINAYQWFIAAFQSGKAFQQLLRRSFLLRDGIRVLDAGCGSGMATLAVLQAMRERNLEVARLQGFDLTPAMLERFERKLQEMRIHDVQLRQADVLDFDQLPLSWADYDLIVSTSMLEYLPKADLPRALAGLRARLAPNGHILMMITRKTPETKVFVEWAWHAERYSKGELLRALDEAGLREPQFCRFPWRYFWLNRANYVVQAGK